MKLMITIGILIFGSIGSWIGALMDHNNYFGIASIALGTVGSFVGIWAGYKAGQYFGT